jgi:hypothetical protein
MTAITTTLTRRVVTLLREADGLRVQAIAAEQSFSTLDQVDGLRRQQFDTENTIVRLMRPVYESVSMEEGMAISKRLHRLAGV